LPLHVCVQTAHVSATYIELQTSSLGCMGAGLQKYTIGLDKALHLIDTLSNRLISARQHICYSALYAIARPSL